MAQPGEGCRDKPFYAEGQGQVTLPSPNYQLPNETNETVSIPPSPASAQESFLLASRPWSGERIEERGDPASNDKCTSSSPAFSSIPD